MSDRKGSRAGQRDGTREHRSRRASGRVRGHVALTLLLTLPFGTSTAQAFESDQYLALEVEIVDSAAAINAFVDAFLLGC